MKYNYNGEEIVIDLLGRFKIEEINKEYVICSFDDGSNNNNISIVILELKDGKTLVDIPDEDTNMVLSFYNALKKEALKEENND